jgi:hypothetical protein
MQETACVHSVVEKIAEFHTVFPVSNVLVPHYQVMPSGLNDEVHLAVSTAIVGGEPRWRIVVREHIVGIHNVLSCPCRAMYNCCDVVQTVSMCVVYSGQFVPNKLRLHQQEQKVFVHVEVTPLKVNIENNQVQNR